jgi:hypothetical protein
MEAKEGEVEAKLTNIRGPDHSEELAARRASAADLMI